ncbi:MAG: hypothetical protein PHW86_02225, partial [Candidatus Bipolaricaulis sp.]|nr:hypothetical protein [Candidatus Bipolaricaulis sp.]
FVLRFLLKLIVALGSFMAPPGQHAKWGCYRNETGRRDGLRSGFAYALLPAMLLLPLGMGQFVGLV